MPIKENSATISFKSADQASGLATFVDVSSLTLPVAANEALWVKWFIIYQSVITTTGARFAVNGPAAPSLLFMRSRKQTTIGTAASTDNFSDGILTAYDTALPASIAEPAQAVNLLCEIEGVFINGANAGTLAARMQSEIAGSNITAKAGSFVLYRRLN